MKVVGVKLNENGKVYYFDAADVNVHENSTVIVQTEKGLQYGIVVKFIPESDISYDIEYKKIVRLTTKSDYKKHMCNLKDADRVDFRQLAKDLGSIYRTRIELRQVGIRDKAREIGGIGPCGRKLCCSNFLTEFDSVSINMAKNQNLSLNPSKINGVCGRLLCCLKYENDNYNEYKKDLPDVGNKVKIKEGEGKIISVDVFKRKYRVLLNETNEIIEVEVK